MVRVLCCVSDARSSAPSEIDSVARRPEVSCSSKSTSSKSQTRSLHERAGSSERHQIVSPVVGSSGTPAASVAAAAAPASPHDPSATSALKQKHALSALKRISARNKTSSRLKHISNRRRICLRPMHHVTGFRVKGFTSKVQGLGFGVSLGFTRPTTLQDLVGFRV